MKLKTQLFGQTYQFKCVKEVLAKASDLRSGDVLAGVAAKTAQERVAAKHVLSELTLNDLRENPSIAYEDDLITRINQDSLNRRSFEQIRNWTVSELREYILSDSPNHEDYERLRKGLTAEMVAGVAKLSSNADLMIGGKKLPVVTKANCTLGLPGHFSCRLQPNDTRDNVNSILAQTYEGLSYGCGDAVIGVNPVTDNVENTARVLEALQEVIDKYKVPTQPCVLSHVTTQMEAIRRGAPAGLIFQSIAGTEKGLAEFGVNVELLDEAYEVGKQYCNLAGGNMMYFETGQGTELSADAHYGADQMTMEARCYALARRYKPHLVNTVVGFIGPEYLYNHQQIIRAGLEDHFMGKLTGLPMGCDACYTNHADTDQNSNENLLILLASAGVNFVIGLPLGDDIMLNYQTNSYHDTVTARQLLNLRPAPEFQAWMETMGLMENGKLTARAGDPSIFFK
ncbi:ethanolamine ammonia-lyase subunit EutB [Ferrimonas lipolytica]|uniref:Ethanolamine ammonia-lyase large subunit n=1 Tax=Ferrimonas lipolytica TaxID=2724191 RepID=A0A6H1U9G9_9GAMM|nr:ethanolamine ammonia-lyase subunit EutB [Ferrimonas lipolytica]QIZ75695.1 ethanolamine ammonia-lyase subunit EutB [Ferrimonas lipolytica]